MNENIWSEIESTAIWSDMDGLKFTEIILEDPKPEGFKVSAADLFSVEDLCRIWTASEKSLEDLLLADESGCKAVRNFCIFLRASGFVRGFLQAYENMGKK